MRTENSESRTTYICVPWIGIDTAVLSSPGGSWSSVTSTARSGCSARESNPSHVSSSGSSA